MQEAIFKLQLEYSPVDLLHFFRTPFPKNTSGRLHLVAVIRVYKNNQTFYYNSYQFYFWVYFYDMIDTLPA